MCVCVSCIKFFFIRRNVYEKKSVIQVQILLAFHFTLLERVRTHFFCPNFQLWVTLTGLFSLDTTRVLEECKLWIQTSCILLKNWPYVTSYLWRRVWVNTFIITLVGFFDRNWTGHWFMRSAFIHCFTLSKVCLPTFTVSIYLTYPLLVDYCFAQTGSKIDCIQFFVLVCNTWSIRFTTIHNFILSRWFYIDGNYILSFAT